MTEPATPELTPEERAHIYWLAEGVGGRSAPTNEEKLMARLILEQARELDLPLRAAADVLAIARLTDERNAYKARAEAAERVCEAAEAYLAPQRGYAVPQENYARLIEALRWWRVSAAAGTPPVEVE